MTQEASQQSGKRPKHMRLKAQAFTHLLGTCPVIREAAKENGQISGQDSF